MPILLAEDNQAAATQPREFGLSGSVKTDCFWHLSCMRTLVHMRQTHSFILAITVFFGGTLAAQQPGWHKFGETRPQEAPPPIPENLTLAAGTWITIRVDEPLSSDRNHAGDGFTATLVQPLVVNGFVVARRGQTFGGRVAEAVKAGRAKGTSRLGLEINEISLVDGQQLPVKTQLISRRGDTSIGRDAVAIGTTTGVGAAVGAGAAGGTGAGVGALAGAAASTIGVLMTRGKATVVYPEMVLTFRLEAPITVATERSAGAFQPVMQEDYEQQPTLYRRGPQGPPPPTYFIGGYEPDYFWGPSLFFYSGPRFYHGAGFRHW
jgi:hypothetical protein